MWFYLSKNMANYRLSRVFSVSKHQGVRVEPAGRQVDACSQGGGAGEEAEDAVGVGLLHQFPLLGGQSAVVIGQTVRHRPPEQWTHGAAPAVLQLSEQDVFLRLPVPQELPARIDTE